ncbi:MAG: homoserine dehydrogenase, partial [Clostridia bacterium]|nr:homoserine dehydrogenase [Clostridia bacterium]
RSIDAVAEVMGGVEPAFSYVSMALKAGKHVVTSNKAVLAAYYDEFTALAAKKGLCLGIEAAVAGGVPYLAALRKAARVEPLSRVAGILNGTTNYILSRMAGEGSDFAVALKAAQELGYAEADPSADIDGIDVQNKTVLACAMGFGLAPAPADIPCFGIRTVSDQDVARARAKGRVIKLLGEGQLIEGRLFASVEPVLTPADSLEAAVPMNFNLATLEGASIGTLKFYGQGAGSLPTGNAVVQDLLDIAAGLPLCPPAGAKPTLDLTALSARWELRLAAAVADEAAALLGDAVALREEAGEAVVFETAEMAAAEFYAVRKQLQEKDAALFAARIL